jgi:hypothetical protein
MNVAVRWMLMHPKPQSRFIDSNYAILNPIFTSYQYNTFFMIESFIHHPAPPLKLCEAPQAVSNVVTGFILIVGALVAFAPAWFAIFFRKNAFGVSRQTLGLQLASAVFIVINVCILKWPTLACCWRRPISSWQCVAINLPFFQVQWCFFKITFHICRSIAYSHACNTVLLNSRCPIV